MDERQNKPLNQNKPWSELNEAEQQAILESWKHTLPEKFDVFCIGNLKYDLFDKTPNIPGRLYVSGNINYYALHVAYYDINVDEDFIVGGYVDCYDINVGGDSIVDGYVDCCDVNVGRRLIVDGDVNSCFINVGDLFDCDNVNANSFPIYASDYACRCYEEEI